MLNVESFIMGIGEGMALIRSRRTFEELSEAYESGEVDKDLRSYYLPKYQQTMIDVLAAETGNSKAAVVRAIIDEWFELRSAASKYPA